jgi:hypothetical protein
VRRELALAAERRGTGVTDAEDAGVMHYAGLLPQDAWALRVRVAAAISKHSPEPRRRLVDLRTPRRDPHAAPPAYVAGHGPLAPASAARASAGPTAAHARQPAGREAPASPTVVKRLQGRDVVRDTLVHPESPEESFGSEARDNEVVRRDGCSAFLVRFDLDGLDLPPDAPIEKATVSFFVWDPSSQGSAKVCAFGLKTPWYEASATWQRPGADASWKGGRTFAFGADTTEPVDHVVVPPNAGSDTVDPPLEYQLDVTPLVRKWISGEMPNHGLAIASVIDRAVDDGYWTRLQVLASEYREAQYTPKLEIHLQK